MAATAGGGRLRGRLFRTSKQMSRAFEASLANQLSRFDRWIAESESLASRTTDEETLQNLAQDLARWRELRGQYALRLDRTKWLNRFAKWTLATFWISFSLLFATALLRIERTFLLPLVAIDVLLLIACGATYVIAIIVRDAVARGRQPWRFSLRSLLVGTTVIAVLLALLTYAFRK